MELKEVLSRIGYVRNQKKLSAKEVSLQIGKSQQYVAKLETAQITLSVKELLKILEVCDFPIDRFFSKNIAEEPTNKELVELIEDLSLIKKKKLLEFLKTL